MITSLTKGKAEYKYGRDIKCLISFIVFIRIPDPIQADGSDLYIRVQKGQKSDAKKKKGLFELRTDFVITLQVRVHLESYSVITISARVLMDALRCWNRLALRALCV